MTQQEYNLARLEAAEGLRPHPDVELWEQLDAERERLNATFKDMGKQIDQLRVRLAARQHDITECVATLAAERKTYGKASDLAQAEITRLTEGWNMRVRRIKELNQQLTAERERWSQALQAHREQLAAERENVKFLERNREIYVNDNKKVHAEITQLRKQLAAERESRKQATEAHGRALRELDQQLAAAQLEIDERGRTIIHYKQDIAAAVEALEVYSDMDHDWAHDRGKIAYAALAKLRAVK